MSSDNQKFKAGAKEENIGHDDMWTFLPHASRYQYTVVFLVAFSGVSGGWLTYWPTFCQYAPPFRCHSLVDDLPFAKNATFDTMYNLIATSESRGVKSYRQCEIINVSDSVTRCLSEQCAQNAIINDLNHTVTCGDYIYDTKVLNNRNSWLTGQPWKSVVSEMDLVCSKSHLDKRLLQAGLPGLRCFQVPVRSRTWSQGLKSRSGPIFFIFAGPENLGNLKFNFSSIRVSISSSQSPRSRSGPYRDPDHRKKVAVLGNPGFRRL